MVVDRRKDGWIGDRWKEAMMGKWMSRDDQKHISGDSLYVYQDPKKELNG